MWWGFCDIQKNQDRGRGLLKAGPRPVAHRVLLKADPQPAAQGTLHGPWPGGPLHSSYPEVQFRILVSGILQRMFWSVFQNGRSEFWFWLALTNILNWTTGDELWSGPRAMKCALGRGPAFSKPLAHGPRPSGPLHSSHPAVQFRIVVSGILQRMFWSVFQNGRWVLFSLQFKLFQCSAILASICCFLLKEKRNKVFKSVQTYIVSTSTVLSDSVSRQTYTVRI